MVGRERLEEEAGNSISSGAGQAVREGLSLIAVTRIPLFRCTLECLTMEIKHQRNQLPCGSAHSEAPDFIHGRAAVGSKQEQCRILPTDRGNCRVECGNCPLRLPGAVSLSRADR